MAGFFGLFGKKTKYVDDPTPYAAEAKESKEAFFLDVDSAKTLGDVEYMRKPKVIKRSFPKTLKGKGGESIKSISSMEIAEVKENSQPASELQSQSGVETNAVNGDRKRTDSSLDMFRQMAKDIRK
jgi:hypothetical protein